MPKFRSKCALIFAFTILLTLAAIDTVAQQRLQVPDMTVAGVKLGDRVSGKALLGIYQPRTGDGGQPTYYFYNKNATNVMKMTAASFDDPYFVTEIEVFSVNDTYRKTHFHLEKVTYFETESGVFIGSRQSGRGMAITLLVGSPLPLGVNRVSPKDIVRRNGEPSSQNKSGDISTMDYRLDAIDLGDGSRAKFGYAARFEFEESRLHRFTLKLLPK